MDKHKKWMQRVLELAEKGRGRTSPNPMVGAVIVKDDKIIGESYHRQFGAAHAEKGALEQAGESALGATLYVNLEPCSHEGKTPPCVNQIIAAGIREVYIGMVDPNPQVNGRGIKILKEAAINVHVGLLEKEARHLNRGFIHYMQKNRPWITLKMAQTADGFIADISGKSQWITSSESRNYVMYQRTIHDGIMVGMGTVFKDDPGLLPKNREGFIPSRIVLDDALRIPYRLKLVADEYHHRTIIVTASDKKDRKIKQLTGSGVQILHAPGDPFGWIDLKAAMRRLSEAGITSIYCEGGSQVAGSLVQSGIVDEIQLFIAPKILGEGISTFSGFMKPLDSAIQLKWKEVQQLGPDILLRGEPV